MKSHLIALFGALLFCLPAHAVGHDSTGAHAVMLAGELAEVSPVLSSSQRSRVDKIFNGTWSSDGSFASRPTLHVNAHEVKCRWSNVDITSASCAFDFGGPHATVKGKRAFQFISLLQMVGVEGDGAAGSDYFSAKHFECQLKPAELAARAGSGAECTFETD